MCCEDELAPPAVAEMLSRYRGLLAERGYDWGDEWPAAVRTLMRGASWCDLDQWVAVAVRELCEPGTAANPVEALLGMLAEPPPIGVAVAHPEGIQLRHPLPFALPDQPVRYEVLIAGQRAAVVESVVTAEHPDLEVAGHRVRAVEPAPAGRLRLLSDAVSRWSLLDERGGGWFPPGALRKRDAESRPFFHGNDLVVDVPAGAITVTVARGCEYQPATVVVEVAEDEQVTVELSPRRLYDAAARGWYGGDLHVHLNYSGDLVCTPGDAALMQQGEGLHLMNLVAGNCLTSLIYDREAFEHFAGEDLPCLLPQAVARFGVEYRNDLFGHFHALGPTAPPSRYQTGHARSQQPQDWPPNSVAAAELRDLGATVGYTHPLAVGMSEDGSPSEVFAGHRSRSTEARAVVADAALGLVDSMDLGGPCHVLGTEFLYHRLLGCGLRLAATAGTDAMLSHSNSSLRSNPPGWCRAYADVGGQPLSVPAWQGAVRAGRTFVTNGPWLEVDVGGCGLGGTVRRDAPCVVPVRASVSGVDVATVEIIGPSGVLAAREVPQGVESVEVTAEVDVEESTWLVAVARGSNHHHAYGSQREMYAHTSPVWIELAGRPVARADDAAWCLDWLDRFEVLAREHGTFTAQGQLDDLLDVIDRARIFYRGII